MYSGYYCKKCKIIPLIRSNITDNKDIKYMVKCKCNINYLTLEEINKKYYINNIEKKHIINEKLIDDIENNDSLSLSLKIKEIHSKIKNNNKQLPIIKNDIISFLNKKMKELENLYDKAIKINDNLEKLILILINSYESLNTNYSNIKNIKYLTDIDFININDFPLYDKINFDESFKDSIKFIDRVLPIQNEELEDILKLSESSCKELKIYNNKLLFIQKDDSICIYPINDVNSYFEIILPLPSLIKFDTDQQNNIICLFPDCIRVFSQVSDEQINNLKKENDKICYNPILDIKPILIIKTKMKYDNIIFWNDNNKENKFIINDNTSINFFKYDLNNNSYDIFYSFKCELLKIELIKYNNNKALILFDSLNLFLFDLSKLKIIAKLKFHFNEDTTILMTQISNEELLITKNNYIYILNLKDFQIKLYVKHEGLIIHVFQLNDKSIIICDSICAKRYSPKTFEMMSVFYNCINDVFYNINVFNFNYIYIINAKQITNDKIALISSKGECLLKKLTF